MVVMISPVVGVHAEMQLLPGSPCPRSMLLDQPFAGPAGSRWYDMRWHPPLPFAASAISPEMVVMPEHRVVGAGGTGRRAVRGPPRMTVPGRGRFSCRQGYKGPRLQCRAILVALANEPSTMQR